MLSLNLVQNYSLPNKATNASQNSYTLPHFGTINGQPNYQVMALLAKLSIVDDSFSILDSTTSIVRHHGVTEKALRKLNPDVETSVKIIGGADGSQPYDWLIQMRAKGFNFSKQKIESIEMKEEFVNLANSGFIWFTPEDMAVIRKPEYKFFWKDNLQKKDPNIGLYQDWLKKYPNLKLVPVLQTGNLYYVSNDFRKKHLKFIQNDLESYCSNAQNLASTAPQKIYVLSNILYYFYFGNSYSEEQLLKNKELKAFLNIPSLIKPTAEKAIKAIFKNIHEQALKDFKASPSKDNLVQFVFGSDDAIKLLGYTERGVSVEPNLIDIKPILKELGYKPVQIHYFYHPVSSGLYDFTAPLIWQFNPQ